jgi:hypothetical protein
MPFSPKRFAYQHPVFGRSKSEQGLEPYRDSVYYLWWEFLRRSERYRQCCESGGCGKLAGLYADFGDVFEVSFREWWRAGGRGEYLFAEELPPQFGVIDEMPPESLRDEVLVVQLPLGLPKRALNSAFQRLLKEVHQGKRGYRHNANSTARYPVTGHVDIVALQKTLRVHDVKREYPDMYLWQVAQVGKAVLASRYVNDGDLPSDVLLKKNGLANTAKRLLNRAELIIAGVERGRFPVLR